MVGAIIYGTFFDKSGSDTASDSSGDSVSASLSDTSLSPSSTCDEWNSASWDDQVALSQSIIDQLNAYDTSSDYAASFADDITTACEPIGSITVATVSASIAVMATADFPPQ